MAFGKSIMSRFSDDIKTLDPAYEGLYDSDRTELDDFLSIACENSEPYSDELDEDDMIIIDDEDEDEDYYDEDLDDDDEDEDDIDEEGCCKENAITDATPQQKRERYFKMVDANPRFDAAKKKEMKANYDKTHPEGLKGANESAADYARALKMLNRDDSILEDDVDDSYESSDYPDDYLSDHANYAAGLRTGYTRLVEKNMKKLNMFQGDDEAEFSANLHTSYARENAFDYQQLHDMAEMAFENAVSHMTGSTDDQIENCESALESLLADLKDM